jgi:hypothetical protein
MAEKNFEEGTDTPNFMFNHSRAVDLSKDFK